MVVDLLWGLEPRHIVGIWGRQGRLLWSSVRRSLYVDIDLFSFQWRIS